MKIIIENLKITSFRKKKNYYYIRISKFIKIPFIFFLFIIFITTKPKSHIKKIIDKTYKNEIINIYENVNKNINYTNLNIANYINIAVNFDNKYIYPLLTFLTSLLDNRADTTFYIIHIMNGNFLGNDTYIKINSIIDKFGKSYCNVSFYNMSNQFIGATTGNYISTAAYYRISLPSLLPDVDKCIYMDTDVINFEDLSEMYNIELSNNTYFCGPLDFYGMRDELKLLKINTDKYMNSGITLMNLKAMKNNDIENKIREFVSHHFLNHHEQTAINAICHNNFEILPSKYSFFALFNSTEQLINYNNEQNESYRYNESELIQAFYHPVSLHYAGWVKPWHKEYIRSNKAYWWYYAKKSGFYQEILNNYCFKKEEVENILKITPNNGKLIKNEI